jgi:hypothetical protein
MDWWEAEGLCEKWLLCRAGLMDEEDDGRGRDTNSEGITSH